MGLALLTVSFVLTAFLDAPSCLPSSLNPEPDQEIHEMPVMAIFEPVDVLGALQRGYREELTAYNSLYSAAGATQKLFAEWEARWGYDSLGEGGDGAVFVPRYPMLSKIAWVFINPVELTSGEALRLSQECDSIIQITSDQQIIAELTRISTLARFVSSQDWNLRVGHP